MTRRTARFVVAGLAVALMLAAGVSRLASPEPDGLERVATDRSLHAGERAHPLAGGPLADYSARGVDDPGLATGAAGVAGVVATFALAGGLVWGASQVARRRARARDEEPTP